MTQDNHDATIAKGIVLIDFWASWCGPCLRFGPIFERVAQEHPDAVFAKVDTEAEQELAAQYGVTSIPTLVVYRDGIPVFGQPGALPEDALQGILGQVRDLNMDDVREQYAAQLKAAGRTEHDHADHDHADHDHDHGDHGHGHDHAGHDHSHQH
jgi:thioredoxin 1